MKAQIISDYHVEFRRDWKTYLNEIPFNQDVDLGICAGDLYTFAEDPYAAEEIFKRVADNYEMLLYVPGNHEYYKSHLVEIEDEIAELETKIPNFKRLRTGQVFEYKGRRFLGDTMWFPKHIEIWKCRRYVSDFKLILGLEDWIYEHSKKFIEWVKQECKQGDVVITHHLPLKESTPSLFLNSPTQPAFVNGDAEQLFYMENKPGAWIHGHTHGKTTYYKEGVQVICNPIGYPSENSALPQGAEPSIYNI